MRGTWLTLGLALIQFSWVLSSDCHWPYYQHYEHKGCKPVVGDNGCPVRFDCQPLTDTDRSTCLHNGRRYKEGEKIKSSDPCDSCSCTTGWKEGDAFIECAEVDCPDWEAKDPSCYMGRKPGDCCPTEMCPAENKDLQKKCIYNGEEYRIGEYIQPRNSCESCLCTEGWTGPGGPGCKQVDCLMGMNVRRLRSGCIPIYIEKRCCPIEIYCDGIYGATPVPFPGANRDNFCHYQGQYYQPGSTAYLETDKHQCISCTCAVPPDFTCVKKACPPMPNKNCKARYGTCCPKYECE